MWMGVEYVGGVQVMAVVSDSEWLASGVRVQTDRETMTRYTGIKRSALYLN